MMIRLFCLLTVLAILPTGPLRAASQLSPELEDQARRIESELIAPCCWTQPVSQHYSEASTQIRGEVRQMLAAGRSEPEILNAYVARYGERILASPPARGFNRLAYILPWAFLVFGSIALLLILRAWKPKSAEPVPASISTGNSGDDMDRRIADELREFEK